MVYTTLIIFIALIQNLKMFLIMLNQLLKTKRPQVHWKYIVFEHNKHQVEDAKKIS